MIPIAILSVIALTLIVERYISLRRKKLCPEAFGADLERAIPEGRVRSICDANRGPLSRILLAGLRVLDRHEVLPASEEEVVQLEKRVEKAMEEAGAKEAGTMKRSLKPLSIIATVAPLLGLLGTVYGMIGAFQASTSIGAGKKTDVLAEGIYEALVTTAAGLTLAIPVVVFFQLLGTRVDKLLDLLDERINTYLDIAFIEYRKKVGRSNPPAEAEETSKETSNPKEESSKLESLSAAASA